MAEPEGGKRAGQRGRRNGGEDGGCLIGKWIGDKTPQLGAKIRIPSVLNEIFKCMLASGGILPKGWMWRMCEAMTGASHRRGSALTRPAIQLGVGVLLCSSSTGQDWWEQINAIKCSVFRSFFIFFVQRPRGDCMEI